MSAMRKSRKMNRQMKIVTGFVLLLLMVGVSGCKLNETPYGTVATGEFYKNQSQAQVGLNGVYARFWWGVVNDDNIYLNGNPTDVITGYTNPNNYDLFSWTPSNGTLQERMVGWLSGY